MKMLTSEQKIEKKKNIAKSTCNLFVQKGYVSITISEIAKVAGVGKGTIYEYFENKEEIVFELMSCLQEDYDIKLNSKLAKNITTKEKLLSLFDIYLNDDETIVIQRQIYKEYLAVLISRNTSQMQNYDNKMMEKYIKKLEDIFNEAIKKGEMIKDSIKFIPSIFASMQGFFISNNQHNSKEVMIAYINNLFALLENKTIKGEVI